ncbi:hypothetical protein J6590_049673 [Homalodisca vitripennis]|nr:hypothetical protein J6590_049673 [Homalodisca vitripennis]
MNDPPTNNHTICDLMNGPSCQLLGMNDALVNVLRVEFAFAPPIGPGCLGPTGDNLDTLLDGRVCDLMNGAHAASLLRNE